jgi:hypothetical protein
VLRPGDTFHSSLDGHLWVVIAESKDRTELICVNFTSQEDYKEQTVVCEANEHPFLTHTSVIAYNYARRFKKTTVQSYLGTSTFKKKAACKEKLLAKICDGMNRSEHVPKHVLRTFNEAAGKMD